MNSPLFSVIIPTFGRPALLGEAIESVLAQTVDDVEIVAVDDASPDPVTVSAHPRVRVLRQSDNGGSAACRNAGVAATTGKFLAFLDDDDRWTPVRLESALRCFERAPVAVCRSGTLREDGTVATPSATPRRILEGDVAATIRTRLVPNMGQTAIAREAWLPMDPLFRASDDIEWWLRIAQAHPVASGPEVGHLFRHHDGDRSGNGHRVRLEEQATMLELHADYFARYPAARAFHLARMSSLAARTGQRRRAVAFATASWRVQPSARGAARIARAALR